ncbi:hypothetical protein PABG_04283 [Paracoccidioides brasiliensis Pb03]|nr:hypothetical protein PABG_04283 [Paracoccidioides brasiliensis Pb03]
MVELASLPTEVILYVAEQLQSQKAINWFSQTNRRFHCILDPYLYRFNAKHRRASALRWAARHSNIEVARKSLDGGANIHIRAKICPHLNVFQEAVCARNRIKKWLARPCHPNESRRQYSLRVHDMPCPKNDAMLLFLLERGAYVDSMFKSRETPLFAAVNQPDTQLVKLLIENGANVNFSNDVGNTILHEAVTGCNAWVVRFLLENGASVHSRNVFGCTPLHLASRGRILVQLWANIERSNCLPGMSSRFCATQCRRKLLECDADAGAKDPYDPDVRCEVVQILIESGSDLEARTVDGVTPVLFGALYGAELKVLRVLVENGARTDIEKPDGTSLVSLAESRHELTEILIANSPQPVDHD